MISPRDVVISSPTMTWSSSKAGSVRLMAASSTAPQMTSWSVTANTETPCSMARTPSRRSGVAQSRDASL